MKKFASMVAAGAILMSTVGIAFAGGHYEHGTYVSQYSFTRSETSAISDTGLNTQEGAGTQSMVTGGSSAGARSLTAGNINLSGRTTVRQGAMTSSSTEAESYTGSNTQTAATVQTESRHHGHHDDNNSQPTTQSMVTGGSGATAGSITVSNVNLSFH